MHDIKLIRANPEAFDRGLARRGLEPLSEQILHLDRKGRESKIKIEQLQAANNAASSAVSIAKAQQNLEALPELLTISTQAKANLTVGRAQSEFEAKSSIRQLKQLLEALPNIPQDDVPDGVDETGNIEIGLHGEPRRFEFSPKQHFEIGEALGLMDFEAAAKLSGARFVVLKGPLARLERALATFMLDLHTAPDNGKIGGYTEINPPLLVRDDVMFGTAQLPKFADDQFKTERPFSPVDFEEARIAEAQSALSALRSGLPEFAGISEDVAKRLPESELQRIRIAARFQLQRSGVLEGLPIGLWLIPTAEVPLTNLVREKVTDEQQLPMRVTAWTPCFRAEAGAAGKDTRGMIRQHQFSKVELVSITTPEQSADEHERMTRSAEEVLKRLELPFRTMLLCAGDMGFASQKTYDIEVWLPGQNTYREISSCSVCGDFQARRMKAEYKPKGGGKRFVHTLNGSGVAVGRALIAVLENYQNSDGSVTIPEALRPYMGGITSIGKAS